MLKTYWTCALRSLKLKIYKQTFDGKFSMCIVYSLCNQLLPRGHINDCNLAHMCMKEFGVVNLFSYKNNKYSN